MEDGHGRPIAEQKGAAHDIGQYRNFIGPVRWWILGLAAVAAMTDHTKLGWIALLTILGMLLYVAAFGGELTPRPADYTPIDYLSVACGGLATDTTMFRFGVEGDVRWAEIYVEDQPSHQQLVAIVAYAPGADGKMTLAEILMPSGQVIRFHSAQEIQGSSYADGCVIASLWLHRT